MTKTIFTVFIVLILFSCSNHEKNSTKIQYSWDSIEIDALNNGLAQDDVPYLFIKDSVEYYVNYNNITHSLNFYNLNTKQFDKKIQLYKSGPDKLPGINEYALLNDTLVVYSNLAIRFFNHKGKLLSSLKLKDICPQLGDKYKLEKKGVTIDNLLELSLYNKSLLLRTYNNYLMPYEKNFYKDSYFCEYNISNGKSNPIKIKYPKELDKAKYYADLATPHIIANKNRIIYNYHFKSSIYVYNRTNKQTNVINFKANHIPPIIKGIKRSKASNTLKCVSSIFFKSKYYNIKYDPYNDLYYIIYSEKPDVNNLDKKGVKKHLIIFNNHFQKLREISINPFFSNRFVITKYGLLFRNRKDESYNKLKLHSLKINVK